ncbi:MAG: pilus assembly protein HicB [bacterium]|nr:pilus assembly protein HicB [bacterium]
MTAAVKARVSLNLPVSLKAAAERYARQDGVSLNQFIATALAEKIGAQGAAAFFAKRGLGGDAASAIAFLRTAPDVAADDGDMNGP